MGTKQELIAYATKEAVEAHIEPSVVLSVIDCESQWNPKAIGDQGSSFGLVQIHNPEQQGISVHDAEDPYLSIDFLVRNLSEGRGDMWTCYRELY